MVYNNILEALGNTPMIRLNHINPPTNAEVLVKFEGLNVGDKIDAEGFLYWYNGVNPHITKITKK